MFQDQCLLVTAQMQTDSNLWIFICLILRQRKQEKLSILQTPPVNAAQPALERHLASNSAVPSHAPLFAFETGADSWSPMSRTWFLRRCNDIWEKDSLSSIKGHGFRIGGTTHLLLLGINPWVVMVQGQWSSQSFLTYWRKCKEILSLFIGFSLQSQESVLSTMNSFKSRLTG